MPKVSFHIRFNNYSISNHLQLYQCYANKKLLIINISLTFNRDPDQIVYVKKVPSSSADNTRTNSIIDSHLLNQKRRKSLKSFRNASLDIGSYLHPEGKFQLKLHEKILTSNYLIYDL